jgi:flagellar biosynthesis/type III secretory pathway protein FliH
MKMSDYAELVKRLDAYGPNISPAANMIPVYAATAEAARAIEALTARVAELEEAQSEAFDEGRQEGIADANSAGLQLWNMMVRYLQRHGIEPANDDGCTAHDLFDGVRNVETSFRTERDTANAKLARAVEALNRMIHAVNNMAVGIGVHNERNPSAPIEGPVVSDLFASASAARAIIADLEKADDKG